MQGMAPAVPLSQASGLLSAEMAHNLLGISGEWECCSLSVVCPRLYAVICVKVKPAHPQDARHVSIWHSTAAADTSDIYSQGATQAAATHVFLLL